MTRHEITTASPLLADDGTLMQVGWARLLDCNLDRARFHRRRLLRFTRVKRWVRYGVASPDLYFSATLAHLGFAGQAFVYVVDLNEGTYHGATVTVPFGRGITLARNSGPGECRFAGRRARLTFSSDEDGRRLDFLLEALG